VRHGPLLAEVEPTFDDPVDQPERGSQKDCPADQDKGCQAADDHPQERVPEGSGLPAKVTFDPTPLYILHAHIVYDDPGKQGQAAGKQASCLQAVNDHRQALKAGLGGDVDLGLPLILHGYQYMR